MGLGRGGACGFVNSHRQRNGCACLVQEVTLECIEKGVQFMIFDDELSPSQTRNVEKVIDKVLRGVCAAPHHPPALQPICPHTLLHRTTPHHQSFA